MVKSYWEQSPDEKGTVILYNKNENVSENNSYSQSFMVLCFVKQKKGD